jgi:hypothetical protein
MDQCRELFGTGKGLPVNEDAQSAHRNSWLERYAVRSARSSPEIREYFADDS